LCKQDKTRGTFKSFKFSSEEDLLDVGVNIINTINTINKSTRTAAVCCTRLQGTAGNAREQESARQTPPARPPASDARRT